MGFLLEFPYFCEGSVCNRLDRRSLDKKEFQKSKDVLRKFDVHRLSLLLGTFLSFKCALVSFHFPFIVKTIMFQLEICIALIWQNLA